MPAPSPDALRAVGVVFDHNFAERGEIGASVSIWHRGEEIFHRSHGHRDRQKSGPWTETTIAPFWSVTKGLSAICALAALQDSNHHLEEPVITLWPEFGRGGKKMVTFEQVLSHQAGIPAIDGEHSIFDYEGVICAIEAQAPHWFPGTKHGYHSRIFGFLLDEIVRRSSGADSLGEFWRRRFAEPLDLDLWIGLPEEHHDRVASLSPGMLRDMGEESAFYQAFANEESLSRRAFSTPGGMTALTGMGDPAALTAGFPALGGVGSARALGKFYALLAERDSHFPDRVLNHAAATLTDGDDAVLHLPTAFAAGMMKDPLDPETGEKRRTIFGPSTDAFGHPGAGGSLGFADPENHLAFAYVMNHLSYGVLPNAKAREMVSALYS